MIRRRWDKACYLLAAMLTAITMQALAQQQPFTVEDGLNVRYVNVEDITEDGRYAAVTTSTRRDRMGVNHGRFADPTYIQKRTSRLFVIDTETGDRQELFDENVQVRQITWSPDGSTLAFFLRKGDYYHLHTYDRERDRVRRLTLKSNKRIASNSLLEWRPDGSGLLLQLRDEGWEQKADSMYTTLTEGPILVQHSTHDFLAWDRVWNINARSILVSVDADSREITELTPDGEIDDLNQAENGAFITYEQVYPVKTDYERSGDSEYELFKLPVTGGGSPDTLISRTDEELDLTWNHAGDRFAYSQEGKVFVRSVEEEEAIEITADFDEQVEEGDTTTVKYSILRWHPEDSTLMLETEEGYHMADPQGDSMELVYEYPENRDDAPRRRLVNWSPDGRYLYMTFSARDHWERGLTRYDLQDRDMERLQVDGDLYSDWEFSENGDRIIFEASNGDLPNELYVADPEMKSVRQLTELNPWLENRKLTRSELIRYMDVDGDTLYGVLYYPVDYEQGKSYPLVANVYEDFFNNGFQSRMNILANAGYFVFRPSVNFETGYPGEAWLKGVTTGINKLMERGLVDGTKLGVQGTSYGGYAVSLLITQTDRFAAAINISGKVDMISFLGDSPKITTRNYDAAEVGQDRIGETLWEATDKYIAHSAVFFVDRIETPLLMLSGEDDWNVPATNQREMYYAMRRLGKEVKWVHYMEGGHGAGRAGRVEDYYHHWNTVLDWYEAKFAGTDEPSADADDSPASQGKK